MSSEKCFVTLFIEGSQIYHTALNYFRELKTVSCPYEINTGMCSPRVKLFCLILRSARYLITIK